MKLFQNLRFITGRWHPFFLLTKSNLLGNSPGSDFTIWIAPFLSISFIFEFICNLSFWFTLANWGAPYWNGVWEKRILKPWTMGKIFTSWVNFSYFSEQNFRLSASEPVSLWHRKDFWPKHILFTCLHPEVVGCWGKVILLLLPCCLCVCGIVLIKNACVARPPSHLPYDDAGGTPRKGSLFLLNVVGIAFVSLGRTSRFFCFVWRLVHQSSLKFCPNNS